MKLKEILKKVFHIHKYTTLLVYVPNNQTDKYDFLLHCDCGFTKLTKLPYGIKEILQVRSVVPGNKTERE